MPPATLILALASPAFAQKPPWPEYPEVKAHVENSAVSDLAREMFRGALPETFIRAGGMKPHMSKSGVAFLWTQAEAVERQESGPIAAVCQATRAMSQAQSLDPVLFERPKLTRVYKAIPRADLPAPVDRGALATYCQEADPRSFSAADVDASTFAEGVQVLYSLVANPNLAKFITSTRCAFGAVGPLCGLKVKDLEVHDVNDSLWVWAGACRDIPLQAYSPGPGNCFFFKKNGFEISTTRGSGPLEAYYRGALSFEGSTTFLSDRR